MLDLLGFSLLDMTPYDRQTWFHLLEDYNRAIWPAYGVTFFLTLLLLLALAKQTSGSILARIPLALLAAGWIWTGAVFQLQYFSQLNWAASWFGLAFIIQGAVLLAAAFIFKTRLGLPSLPEGMAHSIAIGVRLGGLPAKRLD